VCSRVAETGWRAELAGSPAKWQFEDRPPTEGRTIPTEARLYLHIDISQSLGFTLTPAYVCQVKASFGLIWRVVAVHPAVSPGDHPASINPLGYP